MVVVCTKCYSQLNHCGWCTLRSLVLNLGLLLAFPTGQMTPMGTMSLQTWSIQGHLCRVIGKTIFISLEKTDKIYENNVFISIFFAFVMKMMTFYVSNNTF